MEPKLTKDNRVGSTTSTTSVKNALPINKRWNTDPRDDERLNRFVSGADLPIKKVVGVSKKREFFRAI